MNDIIVHSVLIPKQGYEPEECEDACAVSDDRTIMAVADGATQASFSREWAEALVNSFTCSTAADPQERFVQAALDSWRAAVGDPSRLPWYAQAKLEKGSFAAFVGVRLDLAKGLMILTALGDSCAFVVDEVAGTLSSFPYEDVGQMAQYPVLVSTCLDANPASQWAESITRIPAVCSLLLATDAVSRYILVSGDRLDAVRRLYRAVVNGNLEEVIHDLVQGGLMANDDVCILTAHIRSEIPEGAENEVPKPNVIPGSYPDPLNRV